jgi:hypothetical protein
LPPTHLTARKSPHMMGDRNPLNSTTCKSFFFGFVGAKRKLCVHTHIHIKGFVVVESCGLKSLP